MAKTYTFVSKPLIVEIKETSFISETNRSSRVRENLGNISELYHRIISVSTSGTELAQFDNTTVRGAGLFGSSKHIRITNLDDTNYVEITLGDHASPGSGNEFAAFRLDAKKSLVLPSNHFAVSTSDADGMITATALGSAGSGLQLIKAKANTAACDVALVIGG